MAKKKARKDTQPVNPPKSAPAKKAPIMPITLGVVAVFVVVAVVASMNANSVEVVDGQVTRIIATVDECAFATITLDVPADEPIDEVANAVFDALSRTEGVGEVTVYEDPPRVDIDYCQSYSSEPVLREVLAGTGYVTP